MKKYFLISFVFLLIISFYSFSTLSLFTDQETSSNNVLTAGTLDLQVDNKQGVLVENFSFTNLAPDDANSHTFTLKNVGSVSGKPSICIRNVNNTESTGSTEFESDGTPGELGANTLVTAKINSQVLTNLNTNLDDLNDICWSPDNVADTEFLTTGADVLDFNETADFELDFGVPSTTGNDIQGDSVTFDVEFNIEQQ